jgi:hypothetical protein
LRGFDTRAIDSRRHRVARSPGRIEGVLHREDLDAVAAVGFGSVQRAIAMSGDGEEKHADDGA